MLPRLTNFKLDQPDLQKLLQQVEEGALQLPDFQRGWVWREEGIRSLIASITLAYPIGAILLLETGGERTFFPRPVEGAPETDKIPGHLILDGQQRITSMYQAFKRGKPVATKDDRDKPIKRWFYLNIKKCMEPEADRIDAIEAMPETLLKKDPFTRQDTFDLTSRDKEFEHWMVPLHVAFDPQQAMIWQQAFLEYHSFDSEITKTYLQFNNAVLQPLQTYRVPAIELLNGTAHEAVCQVFENVNTGGVKLTVFELLTATFSAEDVTFRLRSDWFGERDSETGEKLEGRQDNLHVYGVLRNVRGQDFLQAVTLLSTYEMFLSGGRHTGCKRKDMLKLTLAEYRKFADRIEGGFVKAAKMLHRLCIFTARNVPYQAQLIPLAAILACLDGKEDGDIVRKKLERWFWCGVLGELYGGGTEARFALDLQEVVKWVEGGDEPRTIRDASFAPTRLLSLRTRNSAAYKGIAALILARGARDFARGDKMGDVQYYHDSVDIHHIFPQAWAKKQKIAPRSYNCVLNRTPLTSKTNRKIGGVAPSEYLKRLEKDVTSDALDSYIRSHLSSPELLRSDNYDDFMLDRARRLLDVIEEATGKKIAGRDSESVCKAFGGPVLQISDGPDTPIMILYDRYAVLEELGGGGMAQAYRALDQETQRQVFLKRTRLDGSLNHKALERELAIYTKLERAEIEGSLTILDYHRDDVSAALVTELADGGTLEEYVANAGGNLSASETKELGLIIGQAIQNLHDIEVIHRDIKPGNIMKVGDSWKLGDFGLAKNLIRLQTQKTMQGSYTLAYAPPEQITGAEAHPSSDVYAFGKVLTFMLTGGTDPDAVSQKEWRELLQQCTQKEADTRLDFPTAMEKIRSFS
jgi:hypothetical protein